ncbi:hypothetical protein [Nesterenkonia pannonica]|uniref:hypothetical protein n=1 Tax=Nesterenkonia pannonica TaxID=1548602 RepID=UPI0021649F57|nr:hypothetical protein [Nesterenkonia pannonica]
MNTSPVMMTQTSPESRTVRRTADVEVSRRAVHTELTKTISAEMNVKYASWLSMCSQ